MFSQAFYKILPKNGYPLSFIHKCIRQVFNKKLSPKTPNKTFNFLLFKLPYLDSISYHIEKELRRAPKLTRFQVMFFFHNTNKLKQQFSFKDLQRQLTRSNVVDRLNCSCGSFYIRQTRRNLVKRPEEHQSNFNS